MSEVSRTTYFVAALDEVLRLWRPGSYDWTWQEEFDDVEQRFGAELDMLTTSIQETGIQEPIHLGTDGRVWDGHKRLTAAYRFGLTEVPVYVRMTPLLTEPTDPENENAIAMPRSQWEQLRNGLAAVQADYEGREVTFGSDVASGLALIDTLLSTMSDDAGHPSRADVKGALVDRESNPAHAEAVSTEWRDGLSREPGEVCEKCGGSGLHPGHLTCRTCHGKGFHWVTGSTFVVAAPEGPSE